MGALAPRLLLDPSGACLMPPCASPPPARLRSALTEVLATHTLGMRHARPNCRPCRTCTPTWGTWALARLLLYGSTPTAVASIRAPALAAHCGVRRGGAPRLPAGPVSWQPPAAASTCGANQPRRVGVGRGSSAKTTALGLSQIHIYKMLNQ